MTLPDEPAKPLTVECFQCERQTGHLCDYCKVCLLCCDCDDDCDDDDDEEEDDDDGTDDN